MYDATALKNLMINDNGFGFDPSTGHTYNLSLSGLEIVRLLNNGSDENEVMDFLTETYDVEQHRAVRDLDTFMATLCQYGLLVPQAQNKKA
jgi:hypothetical protein